MTKRFPLAWPAGWPRTATRQRAKFSKLERQYRTNAETGSQSSWVTHKKLTIDQATKRVQAELYRFGVPEGEAIISTNLELRIDGYPRSGQRNPDDPGVAVYWRRHGEPMKVMAIDLYDVVADNLAAIASTLNAMRAIERHGGAQILERAFTGFDALTGPGTTDWRKALNFPPAPFRPTKSQLSARYRMLAQERHPDNGGSNDAMAELNTARDQAMKEAIDD